MPANATHLEARIVQVLETPPAVVIPEGFAARIAFTATARYGAIPRQRSVARFGALGLRISLGLLLLAMLLAARFLAPTPTTLILQGSFALEFIALIVFLNLRPTALR